MVGCQTAVAALRRERCREWPVEGAIWWMPRGGLSRSIGFGSCDHAGVAVADGFCCFRSTRRQRGSVGVHAWRWWCGRMCWSVKVLRGRARATLACRQQCNSARVSARPASGAVGSLGGLADAGVAGHKGWRQRAYGACSATPRMGHVVRHRVLHAARGRQELHACRGGACMHTMAPTHRRACGPTQEEVLVVRT